MSYRGYLLRIGTGSSAYTITGQKLIKEKSYQGAWNVQDLDAYQDANGELHRNPLEHVRAKVEFETLDSLTNEEIGDFYAKIRDNYVTTPQERKVFVSAYIPELDDYVEQYMYMVTPQIKIKSTKGNIVKYEPIRVAFVGY